MLVETSFNPDVLSCLANLSNDEVFTPPQLANQLLDLLPETIWQDPMATFLDPACKTGVFLREAAKRFMVGLEPKIPDRQKRVNHIFGNQLYGIAISELTGLMARRSLYCSRLANGKYSAGEAFTSDQGNVYYSRIEHVWERGHCIYCGANKEEYSRGSELETHAYQFTHTADPKEIFNMKFDVVISNPPYQISDGGFSRSARPIYDEFVLQAKKIQPRFLTMIIPARWFAGGKGLDSFRSEMLTDNRIRKLVDFPDASDCFPGVQLTGGVCYFLWDRDNPGNCIVSTSRKGEIVSSMERPLLEEGNSVFIRWNEAVSILKKVKSQNEGAFAKLVSPRKPFGLDTTFKAKPNPDKTRSISLFQNKGIGYIGHTEIIRNPEWVNQHKVLISMAYGAGEDFPHQIINKPFYGGQNTACTETYLVIGPFSSKVKALNVISYMQTKFFRFLVLLSKSSQHATAKVYTFAPLQDFDQPWSDEKLYRKYKLTGEEISFIESIIRPMEIRDAS